ncbi:MAG: hypothetical protein VCE75_08565 [Alphaproteobacteria bacterium]
MTTWPPTCAGTASAWINTKVKAVPRLGGAIRAEHRDQTTDCVFTNLCKGTTVTVRMPGHRLLGSGEDARAQLAAATGPTGPQGSFFETAAEESAAARAG